MLARLPTTLAILISLAAAVTSNGLVSRTTGPRCGSELTPEAVAESEAITASLLALDKCSGSVTGAPVENFVVPVLFNVIYNTEIKRRVQGNVTDSQIHEQISVLNRDFSESGLSFELSDIVRTPNARWFHDVKEGNEADFEMKAYLRKGDVTTLNIYTVGFSYDTTQLGYATFPVNSKERPTEDGIVLNYSVLPGGTHEDFNKGRTLTHEVGHWVGLYHTFEGGCSEPGDHVDDTPAEAYAAKECKPRNTCSGRDGTDPIHNYMDYTNDECANNFTPGQIRRLRTQIRCHRGITLVEKVPYSLLAQTSAKGL